MGQLSLQWEGTAFTSVPLLLSHCDGSQGQGSLAIPWPMPDSLSNSERPKSLSTSPVFFCSPIALSDSKAVLIWSRDVF